LLFEGVIACRLVDKERRFGRTVSHLGYGFPVGSLSALIYMVSENFLQTSPRKMTYHAEAASHIRPGTVMRPVTTFESSTDRIYDGDPKKL